MPNITTVPDISILIRLVKSLFVRPIEQASTLPGNKLLGIGIKGPYSDKELV